MQLHTRGYRSTKWTGYKAFGRLSSQANVLELRAWFSVLARVRRGSFSCSTAVQFVSLGVSVFVCLTMSSSLNGLIIFGMIDKNLRKLKIFG
jgi:hypothetical protein